MARLTGLRGAFLLACVATVAGCGAEPLPVAPTAPRPTARPVAPAPGPNAAPRRDAASERLLAAVAQRVKSTRNWTALARTDNVGPDGVNDYNTARVYYKLPDVMSATVITALNEKKKGTRVVYDGGEQVKVRTYFFGFLPIRVTISVHDARIVDRYKRTLRETGTRQLLNVLLHAESRVKHLGVGEVAGEPVELVEVRSPISWSGLEREVIGISARTGLPVLRDCYDARQRRIFHLELREMRTNIRLTGDEFTVD